MNIRKLTALGGAAALLATLSLGLTTVAGAASGYPGTTTVTTVPGGSTSPGGSTTPAGGTTAPGGSTSPAASTNPATGTGPSDPCATSPGACSSSGAASASAGTLAFTGADLLALVIGALFLLTAGTLLVVFTRRRARHQPI